MIDNSYTKILNKFSQRGITPEFQLALASFVGSPKFSRAISLGLRAATGKKDWQTSIILFLKPEIVENSKLPLKEQNSPWDYFRFQPAALIIDNPQKIKNAQQRTGIIADVERKAVEYETYPMVKLCRKLEKQNGLYFIDYTAPNYGEQQVTIAKSFPSLPDNFPFPRLKVSFNTEYGEFDVISPNNMHMHAIETALNDSFEKYLENSKPSRK
ncbi:MAG: hypothetical protein NC218_12830, partial [Acetobacter sp.]|nr:hypothetical protein [Acetobacter sp.]